MRRSEPPRDPQARALASLAASSLSRRRLLSGAGLGLMLAPKRGVELRGELGPKVRGVGAKLRRRREQAEGAGEITVGHLVPAFVCLDRRVRVMQFGMGQLGFAFRHADKAITTRPIARVDKRYRASAPDTPTAIGPAGMEDRSGGCPAAD